MSGDCSCVVEIFTYGPDGCIGFEMAEAVSIHATPTTWDGTGLPPVGTVCEVDYEGWAPCEIIAHFQQRCGMVAAFTIDQTGNGAKTLDAFGAEHFRPLRTHEQLAVDEREKAVDEMCKLLLETYSDWGEGVRRKVCSYLYDAGYRKVEAAE